MQIVINTRGTRLHKAGELFLQAVEFACANGTQPCLVAWASAERKLPLRSAEFERNTQTRLRILAKLNLDRCHGKAPDTGER